MSVAGNFSVKQARVVGWADVAARAAHIASLSLQLREPDVAIAWLPRAPQANPSDPRIAAALASARAEVRTKK